MKLFYTPNSPYARKCRIVMLEKGLESRVDLLERHPLNAANFLENSGELLTVNPLGTVPALVTDSGLHLCDSTIICEYLDTLAPQPVLYPTGDDRLCVMAMAVMADGMTNAAVTCTIESRRPEDKRYPAWVYRKEAAILRTIEKFSGLPMEKSALSIGTISLAVALTYVSFRLPHLDWRTAHPALATWLDDFSKRPSMQATKLIL